MNTDTLKRTKWFWSWQDDKEEAWLGSMSQDGWHLKSVAIPCVYSFMRGEPCNYTYRLDYMLIDKTKLQDYFQIYQDAGWEYIGELSNWRYWRKQVQPGEADEIFTDRESKVKKYQRLLAIMSFLLFFLIFVGLQMLQNAAWANPDLPFVISVIYSIAMLLYALLIPIYVVVVVQVLRRIRQLKKKAL
jgi:hypothetical protein